MPFCIYINGRIGRFKNFLKKERAVISAFILALVLFSVFTIFSEKIIYFFRPLLFKAEISRVENSLSQELEYVKEQTKQIAKSGIFNSYIEKKDILNILSFLNDEKNNRNLGIMLVTDKDGIVLTRTKIVAARGDNIFQTMSWGQALYQETEIAFIERGKALPLIMAAGQLIKKNGEIIGSIFSGHYLNNEYATKFKERYLKNETHLAFYTKEEGIIGNTFKDKETVQLLSAYFGIGSDLIVENLPELTKEVRIGDKYYFVKNIVFPGIKEGPGGVLIFLQNPYLLQSLGFGIGALLIFLLLTTLIYITPLKNSVTRRKHNIILITGSLIIFFITASVFFYKLDKDSISLKKPTYVIYNSIIKFEPESDVLDRFFEKRIAIEVSTGGESINVVGAVINYDPETVRVLDIITINSFCRQDLFIKKNIDNENGIVDIICGLPSPGFSSQRGIMAELIIQPLKSGQISLYFDEKTQILANDGLGTNVLRLAIDGSYNIISYDEQREVGDSFTVFSYTHPNSERWYNRRNVYFSWLGIEGAIYRYALNDIPDFIPGEENITSENSLSFNIDKDGVYYLHLLPEKNGISGTVVRYKVMIDSTPPLAPVVRASHTRIEPGEMVRFDFTSQDELSGMQEGFYVSFNEGIFLPVAPPLYIPFLAPGEHTVTIRAFDKASNFNDTDVRIKVGIK